MRTILIPPPPLKTLLSTLNPPFPSLSMQQCLVEWKFNLSLVGARGSLLPSGLGPRQSRPAGRPVGRPVGLPAGQEKKMTIAGKWSAQNATRRRNYCSRQTWLFSRSYASTSASVRTAAECLIEAHKPGGGG